ncbi:MAG TPA: NTP transferase domain-containing protein [Verrucomicrobiae bacterium]|jgi:regulator of RNase E activity RraA/CMP-N-acetylneuraminic acid synthetase|nr:NTP transferase domain-containing protein [Verrucomicrobiae bacterium]
MKVAAFLPAKGTSNRVPNKNTMLLDGDPMFLRSLRKLIACSGIDEVWLDTESHEIADLASDLKCKWLRRDPVLANNKTDGNQLFFNEIQSTDADICVMLLCTSPFIQQSTIEKAIEILKTDSRYDSVVAVRKEKQYLWQQGHPAYSLDRIPNSIDLPDTTVETMGLYVMRRDAVLQLKRRIGNNPYLLEIEPIESVDVNWPRDFELANLIAVGLREQERRLFNNLKLQFNSPLLSDVLDDLGIDGVLSKDFKLNLPQSKVLGRAKTMQIDSCKDDEDFKKIYDSLALYDHVVSNDVVVVANHAPNFAFFGELNANLAIRAGAVGAIIDGVTRDTRDTVGMGFPVFAKGHYCKDTRKRGVVTSRNRTVLIDEISIHKDDLIFGDTDGIVVIPKQHEKAVLAEALKRRKNESSILLAIAEGMETNQLVKEFGLF